MEGVLGRKQDPKHKIGGRDSIKLVKKSTAVDSQKIKKERKKERGLIVQRKTACQFSAQMPSKFTWTFAVHTQEQQK